MYTCVHWVLNHHSSGTDKLIAMKTVLVFKTSVYSDCEALKVKPLLDSLMGSGECWNFDLEDCDHILRVETKSLQPGRIINKLLEVGYTCEELED